MTSNYGHGYVNGQRTGRKGNKAKYVNEEDLGSSVQYDSIDYDSLSHSERAQEKHIYLDLNNDKEAGKVTARPHRVDSIGKGGNSGSSVKTKGRWKFVVIIVVLLILLIGVAIAFGILYFKKNEVSSTTSPQKAKEAENSSTPETTRTNVQQTSTVTLKTATENATTTESITHTENLTTTSPVQEATTTTETLTIEERCKDFEGLIPHPDECQAYYNCSNVYEYVPEYFEQYLMECTYPRLFSTVTMSCEHFEKVTCGGRKEAKNGCDYRANMCGGRYCSVPCFVQWPVCEGKADGYNVDNDRLWSPYYVICYKERFVVRNTCPKDEEGATQLFSPDYDACVSLDRIPPERGGTMPNCTGKADGNYPNEHGRCNRYTVCAWGQYIGYEACTATSDVFDEVLKTCRHYTQASYCICGKIRCT